jgi:hypothetical protein
MADLLGMAEGKVREDVGPTGGGLPRPYPARVGAIRALERVLISLLQSL